MKKGRWADHPNLLRQRSRSGVIRAATLIEHGMDSRTIYRRCLPGGPWRRLLPGVILLQNAQPSEEQRVTAALLHAGAEAMVTGAEACRRYGLDTTQFPMPAGEIHLLIPHGRRVISSGFVLIERTHRHPQAVVRAGVPLAPLPRAVLDAVRRVRVVDPVQKLLIAAIQQGRCSPASLFHELECGSTRGTALPRRLLAEVGPARSIAETDAMDLLRGSGLPQPMWNVKVLDPGGGYLGRPDGWWDDVALAWEIDSYQFHFEASDYARTVERNSRYAAAGILVIQTLPSEIRNNPAAVLRTLAAAHEAASARARPPVQLCVPG
jgi:hypothetical protein